MQVYVLHKLKGIEKIVIQKGHVSSFIPCADFFPRLIRGRSFVFKYYILNTKHSKLIVLIHKDKNQKC